MWYNRNALLLLMFAAYSVCWLYRFYQQTVTSDHLLWVWEWELFTLSLINKLHSYNNSSLISTIILGEEGTAEDTISFGLKVKCTHNPNAHPDATQPDMLYKHNNVYTKDMVWIPVGNQTDLVSCLYKE